MSCSCGNPTTKTYFANVQLCSNPGPGGAAFHTGEVGVEVCQKCGGARFVIPEETRKRFLRS
jgi:hypothetical protein